MFPTFATSRLQEILAANVALHGREMADEFCLKMPDFAATFMDLLHAINIRHGTEGFTSPPREGVLRIFFCPEPPNVGTKGQHATSIPPKPLKGRYWEFKEEAHVAPSLEKDVDLSEDRLCTAVMV